MARSSNTFVYFIHAPSVGLIKIGYSAYPPDRRLDDLRSLSPVPLERMALLVGGLDLERALHVRFARHRSHREWFRADPELLVFIRDHAYPWDAPVKFASEIPSRFHQRQLLKAHPRLRLRSSRSTGKQDMIPVHFIGGPADGMTAGFLRSQALKIAREGVTQSQETGSYFYAPVPEPKPDRIEVAYSDQL